MSHEFSPPLRVRHSARAKYLRLVVKSTGVELVIPPDMAEAEALAFMHSHREWAARKFQEMRRRQAENPLPKPQRLETGATVPFQGREVPLVIHEGAGRRTRIQFDGRFVIAIPAAVAAEAEQHARSALFAWVKNWLQAEAGRIAAQHAPSHGLMPSVIRVKRMRTRWGSCGPRNDINLNWLLAFAPPTVLEYVVVHELCHIRHRDHSAQFWDLVAQHLPGWPQERLWLKRQGSELIRRFG